MKNKKLFAILTLVCFMFTLMPVAAFAAGEKVFVEGADGVWGDEVTVLEGSFNVKATATTGAAYAAGFVYYAVNEDGEGVATTVDGSMYIAEEGTYEVYAVTAASGSEVYKYVASVGDPAEKVQTLEKYYGNLILADSAKVTVDAKEYKYFLDATRTDFAINGNNGFSKDGIVDVTLYKYMAADKSDKVIVKGEELSVKTAGYVNVTAVNANGLTTDKKGQVRLNVTSAVAGNDYKVVVKHEEAKDLTITVDVNSISVDGVEVASAPKAPVNKANPVDKAGVEFKFTDANGAPVSVVTGDRNITLVSKPANSTLKSENFALNPDDDGIAGVYDLAANKLFDKEGEYVIRVSLENGDSATATVKAAKFDEAVRIMFAKAPTSVALDQSVEFKTVLAVDANGVTSALDLGAGNDVTLSANGKAIDTFVEDSYVNDYAQTKAKYVLTAKDDEDYIGSTITVLAKYGDFVATTEVAVVDEAMSIAYKNTAAETGVSTSLVANVLDSNGDVTVLSSLASSINTEVVIIDKPANAVAVATVVDDWNTAKQQAVVNFLASEAGEYKIQTIITYTVSGADKYISDIETITVGGGVNTFKDVIVMSIGADKMVKNSDVVELLCAPVIKDSRTFVPFRSALEAFGATVDYIDGQVIAEMNGVKVVMTAGDKAYTVNGVAKVADVAPYLNVEASTTMVPVSFVVSEFGINFECIYNADGTVADVLFTK